MNRPSPKFAEAARLALIACIVALACGCTSTVRTSPDSVKIEPTAVSHLPARSVTLVNGHASETQLRFSSPPYTLIVEPKHMTGTAIEMLRRALPSGPRPPAPGIAITLDADYGDGTRSRVSGEGHSARGADRSFETALLNAWNRLLGDPRFVACMKR